MTHAESLTDLALWATDCQSGHYDAEPWANYLTLGPSGPSARSHGASAVQAIRLYHDCTSPEWPAEKLTCCVQVWYPGQAVYESVHAFSAACEAVGIHADANGHHNL